VAVGSISAATTALVVQFSNASSETLAWSNRLGIASSRLQSLGFAAQQYQITNEALTDGLKELSLRTDEFTSVLERARQFSRESLILRETISGFGNILAAELLPAYREFVQNTQQYLQANADLIKQNIRRFVEGLIFSLRMLLSILGDVASGVGRVVELIGGWERAISLLVSALVTLAGLRIVKLIGAVAGVLWQAKRNAGLLGVAMALLGRTPLIAAFIALVFLAEDLIYWLNGQDSVIGRLFGSYGDLKKSASDALDTIAEKTGPLRDRVMEDFGRIIDISKEVLDAFVNIISFDPAGFIGNLSKIGDIMLGWLQQLGRDLVVTFTDQLPNWMRNLLGFAADKVPDDARGDPRQRGMEAGREALDNVRFLQQLADQAGPNALVNPPGPVPRGVTDRNVNVRADVSLQVPQGTSEQQRAALEQQTKELFDREMDRVIMNSLWDFQVQE